MEHFYLILYSIADNNIMNELTAREIADILHIEVDTAKRRIQRLKIKPIRYVGPTAIYDPSVPDAIRNVPDKGRPKKQT
jgi:sporulation protein YlmC with PRC-barrel domain